MSAYMKYLRRYTHLESLRCILCTKSLTLLDCRKWKDINDSHFMRLYMEERGLKSLLAVCLTGASERFHLWHVFCPKDEGLTLSTGQKLGCRPYSGHSGLSGFGVRIRFDRSELIQAVKKCEGVTCQDVEYMTLGKLKKLAREGAWNSTAKVPFIKRYGFRDEREFRIIYESKTESLSTKSIPIPLSSICEIKFSFNFGRADYRVICDELRSLDGCQGLKFRRSRLTDSKTWKAAGDDFVRAAKRRI